MKTTVYLRVAKGARGPKFAATAKPNHAALTSGSGWNETTLPTVAFAVELDIPEEAFKVAEQVLATLEVPADRIEVAAEVQ